MLKLLDHFTCSRDSLGLVKGKNHLKDNPKNSPQWLFFIYTLVLVLPIFSFPLTVNGTPLDTKLDFNYGPNTDDVLAVDDKVSLIAGKENETKRELIVLAQNGQEIAPSLVTMIELVVMNSPAVADGQSKIDLVVILRDNVGNPLAGVAIELLKDSDDVIIAEPTGITNASGEFRTTVTTVPEIVGRTLTKALVVNITPVGNGVVGGPVVVIFTPASTQPTVLSTDCNAVTEISTIECQSLLELYNSTDGPNWINNDNWNVTNTPCNWYGVTCENGGVIELDFWNNKLTGSIPNFSGLSNLKELTFYGDQLTGLIPNFTGLPNLERIIIRGNQLTGSIPNFSGLPNLKVLDLKHNQLTGSIPDFSNLPNLTWLSIIDNKLTGSIPNFNKLAKLETLYLTNNQLTGPIPDLGNLPLKELDLENNSLCKRTDIDYSTWGIIHISDDTDTNWQEQLNEFPDCSAPNQSPIATFTVSPPQGQAPLAVTLDASFSSDSDGSIVSYQWEVWDGNYCNVSPCLNKPFFKNLTGKTVSVILETADEYTITLTITDDQGAIGTQTDSIITVNQTNQVFCSSGQINFNNTSTSCSNGNCSGSGVKFTCNSESCQWCDANNHCGQILYNGTTPVEGGSINCSDGQCSYSIQTGNSSSGGQFICQTHISTVNQPPIATFTVSPQQGQAPLPVTLDASSSSDPDGSIVSYEWLIGGQNLTGKNVSITLENVAYYPIILTVTDDKGATDKTAAYVTTSPPAQNPIISQANYKDGDILLVTLPPLSADQNQCVAITLPKNSGVYVLDRLNALMPFDGINLPVWQGDDVAIEALITPGIPRGEYTVYLLRMLMGIYPMSAPREQWSLGMANFSILDSEPYSQPIITDLPIFSNFVASNQSLFQGENPIQTDVGECVIDPSQMVVLRGKVTDAQAQPLVGVTVTIDRHTEYGQTLSQADGSFSFAVNAELLTVNYAKEGYMPLQRKMTSLRGSFAMVSDVALVLRSPETPINQSAGGVTPVAGEQDAKLLFPQDTQATMVLPDCSVQTLSNDIAVRATEYTVGDPGVYSMTEGDPDSQRKVASQMPFPLPPGTGYTYALELSVDQATDTRGRPRAREVNFDQTLPLYVDNFLNFPVGDSVPTGWYDRTQSAWIPSKDGRIVKLLSIDDGLAVLDIEGSGQPATLQALAELGVTEAERRQVAVSHEVGKTLWRVPIEHFSPWDCNWPFGPPEDATGPNVPEGDTKDDDKEEDPCEKAGCIIEAENQVLGETIPIVGTPFNLNYRSSRVPGRKSAYTLDIPVYSEAEPLPPSIQRIEVEVNIAGQQIQEIYPKDNVPKTDTFVWDGLDAFGRRLQGQHNADVRISYVYKGDYKKPVSGTNSSFGLSSGSAISGDKARQEISYDKKYARLLGVWNAQVAGFGGLTLDIHHAYDQTTNTLYRGDGSQKKVSHTDRPSPPYKPGPEHEYVELTDNDIRITHCTTEENSCGKVLVGAARIDTDSIQWISPDTANYFSVSGNHVFGFTGPSNDNSTQSVDNQWGFQGDSASSYISNPQPSGAAPSIGHFFAPDGEGGFSNGNYYSAQITDQKSGSRTIELKGEGINDNFVTPAITLDIQVNGETVPMNDASAHCVSASTGGEVIFTITPKVNNDLVATMGTAPVQHVMLEWCSNDNYDPHFITESMTPNNFALNDYYHHIKSYDCDKLLVSVNKTIELKATHQRDTESGFIDYTFSVRGHYDRLKPAKWLGSHKTFHLISLSDNTRRRKDFELTDLLYPYSEELEKRATRSSDNCPFDENNDQSFNGTIASQDGGLLYQFEKGHHVQTLDSLMGTVIYTFTYNGSGYLIEIVDIDGDTTTIERDAENKPVAIVAPYGQRTTLTLDANGYLASATNPANETYQLVYTPDGLLTQYIDPRGNADNFEYDALGLFVKNVNPVNGGYTVTRTDFDTPEAKGHITTMMTAEGRKTEYKVATVNGKRERTNTAPDGTVTQSLKKLEGDKTIRTTSHADGTFIWTMEEPDTRLVGSMQSATPKLTAIVMPSDLKAEIGMETITDPPAYADDYDPLNLNTLTQKVTVNGRVSTSVFDKTAKTITATSATGRQSLSVLDDKGRVIKEQVAGFADTAYSYDDRGRLTTVSVGEGIDLRTATLSYDSQGNIEKVTDALNREVSFSYDAVGRVISQVLTDGRQILYSYDAGGNVVAITPPGRPAHSFAYNGKNLQSQYTPPDAGLVMPQTQYLYNRDEQLTKIVRPDGQAVDFAYDATKGRLNTLNTPHGQYSYAYDEQSGNLTAVTAPDGGTLSYQYDGSLPLSVTWGNGQLNGSLAVTYDNNFRVTATNINGENSIEYQYDADSLLIKAGDLNLIRDEQNGLLIGTQLYGAITQRTYNQFGELTSDAASHIIATQYGNGYTRDKLGRITQKVESIQGASTTYAYEYDSAGRLITVMQDGIITEQYSYDANGNRNYFSANLVVGGIAEGSYDEQDRLLQYGDNTYAYTDNGELLSKTSNGATTQYNYDVLGNLRSVQLPDGRQIEYVIDASGRRLGKKLNGVLTQGFLYQGSLNPVAEFDGNGTLVARFVYGSKANVPDYIIKAGSIYRIFSDHLGSPRLIINLDTDDIVQRIDYDAFGNVVFDSNPGFQPFGFAGGIYDVDTGLVRFGARDYDAESGRWTAKDPITFASGDTNLYGYALNDPINFIDPNGRFAFLIPILGNALLGAGIEALIQILENAATGRPWHCLDWKAIGISALGSSLSFGLSKLTKIKRLTDLGRVVMKTVGSGTINVITSGLGGSKNSIADFLSGSLGSSLGGAVDDIFDNPSFKRTGSEVVKNLGNSVADALSAISNNLMKGSSLSSGLDRNLGVSIETAGVKSIFSLLKED